MKEHINSIIIGLAIIIAIAIIGTTYKNRNRSNDIINVTGLGKKDFAADLIVWSATFSKKRTDLQSAYSALKEDRDLVINYLNTQKINEKEVVFSAVDINQEFNYTYDERGNQHSEFTGYRLSQKVEVESKDVNRIEEMSRQITQLINNGVELSSSKPEYYYTKLAELKVEMIAEATKDATLRAQQIAENSGAKVGHLRYAQMGIFQIIGQNSSEDYTWGGAFNTSSKNKTATITMKLQFGID